LITGSDGTIYLAEGQIFMFDADGKEIRRYNVDERPISMVWVEKMKILSSIRQALLFTGLGLSNS
jgi:hypothetical protein